MAKSRAGMAHPVMVRLAVAMAPIVLCMAIVFSATPSNAALATASRPTSTHQSTATHQPTATHKPTSTHQPTATHRPTSTHVPTATPTTLPTRTPIPVTTGCDFLNSQLPQSLPGMIMETFPFRKGDIITMTAGDPSTGSPTIERIIVDGLTVAQSAFPGSVSYAMPTSGIVATLTFEVVHENPEDAHAMVSFGCVPAS